MTIDGRYVVNAKTLSINEDKLVRVCQIMGRVNFVNEKDEVQSHHWWRSGGEVEVESNGAKMC